MTPVTSRSWVPGWALNVTLPTPSAQLAYYRALIALVIAVREQS